MQVKLGHLVQTVRENFVSQVTLKGSVQAAAAEVIHESDARCRKYGVDQTSILQFALTSW